MSVIRPFLLFITLGFVSITPAAADLDAGIAALQQGNFGNAQEIFIEEAGKGNPIGEFMLGVMAEQGFGQEKNPEKAIEWYTKAADRGMASAAYNLARFYENGTGVEKDVKRAIDHLTAAAVKGHGRAMHNLGRIYESDTAGKPDLAEALKWYSASATFMTGADRAIAVDTITNLHERMTAAEIQEGDSRYNAWIADHPPPSE